MSENLSQLFTQQFAPQLLLRLQQEESELRGLTMEGSHVGQAASPVQYVGPVAMRPAAGGFQPLNRSDPTFTRRWVTPQPYEDTIMVDPFDRMETIVDPVGPYAEAHSAAVARTWDDILISSALGTAQTGVDKGTFVAETFAQAATNAGLGANGNLVADTFGNGSTTIGMTVDKMIELKRVFRHLHVPIRREALTLILGSQQEADLLRLVQVVSTEFNSRPVLVDGEINSFLKFNIRFSERLATTTVGGNVVRNCFCFVRSGMYLGIWQDMMSDVTIRKDLSGQPIQLYVKVFAGATRLEPGRVLQVNCYDPNTGADIEGGITGI